MGHAVLQPETKTFHIGEDRVPILFFYDCARADARQYSTVTGNENIFFSSSKVEYLLNFSKYFESKNDEIRLNNQKFEKSIKMYPDNGS